MSEIRANLADFHNHVMPGVDDGASDTAQSEAALHAFVAQEVRHVIATPHVDGSLTHNAAALAARLSELDEGWSRLTSLVQQSFPQLRVERGAEVMLDTPQPQLGDARLRLAGGRFVLVEFPFMSVPPHSASVVRTLVDQGVVPVIAHPERYAGVTPGSPLPEQWCAGGALLQVNAGSITGRYGGMAQQLAYELLARGQVSYICSDYHARGVPATAAARALLGEADAAEQSELLMSVNPRRLLDDALPLPVPAVAFRRGVLSRLREWLK